MGRKPKEVRRNYRRDTIQDPSPDQLDEAYEEARKLVSLHEDPKHRSDRSPHAILPDVNKLSGDLIQAVVALRIQGFKDVDIAKQLNTSQPNISRLETNHPAAFAKAEVHALQQAERKFLLNLWGIRAALSEHAPKMIEVLAELANNPECKENIRRQAAIDILNLTGVGYSRQTVGGKDRDLQAGARTYIQNIVKAGGEAVSGTVIEAEDISFEEENS